MGNIGSATIDFKVNNKDVKKAFTGVNQGFNKAEKSVNGFNKKLKGADKAIGGLSSAFKKLAVSIGGILIIKDVFATFGKFEQSVSNAASVTGAFGDALDKTKKNIEDVSKSLGKTTVFAASDAAAAFYDLASAGYDVANMTEKELKPVLDLAAATQSDLKFATETVTGALASLGLGFESSEALADVFTKTIASSKATLDKLNQSYSIAGAAFEGFNVHVEEANAALGVLYDRNLDGSRAGNVLRNVLTKTAKVTDGGMKVLKKYNLALADVDVETRGLIPVLETLGAAQLSNADSAELFGVEYGSLAKTLFDNVGEVKNLNAALEESGGTAAKIAEDQLDTLQGSLKLLASNYESLKLVIGEELAPVLREFAELLGDLASDEGVQNFFREFVGILKDLFTALMPIIRAVFDVAKAFLSVLGPAIKVVVDLISALKPVILGAVVAFAAFRVITKVVAMFALLNAALRTNTLLLGVNGIAGAVAGTRTALSGVGVTLSATTGLMTGLTGGIKAAFAAFKAFSIGLLTNPIFLAAAAIGVLAVSIYKWFKRNEEIKDSIATLKTAMDGFSTETIGNFNAALTDLEEKLLSAHSFWATFEDIIAASESLQNVQEDFVTLGTAMGENEADLREWLAEVDLTTEEGAQLASERLGAMRSDFNDMAKNAIQSFKELSEGSEDNVTKLTDDLEQWQEGLAETYKTLDLTDEQIEIRTREMMNALEEEYLRSADIADKFIFYFAEGLTSAESLKKMADAGHDVSDASLIKMATKAREAENIGEETALLYAAGVINKKQYAASQAADFTVESLNAMIHTNKKNKDVVADSFGAVVTKTMNTGLEIQAKGGEAMGDNAIVTGENVSKGMAQGVENKKGLFFGAMNNILGFFNDVASQFGIDKIFGIEDGAITEALGGLVASINGTDASAIDDAVSAYDELEVSIAGATEEADKFEGSSGGGGAEKLGDDFKEQFDTITESLKDMRKQVAESIGGVADDYKDEMVKLSGVDEKYVKKRADIFKKGNEALVKEGLGDESIKTIVSKFQTFIEEIDTAILAGLGETFEKNLTSIGDLISTIETSDFEVKDIFEFPSADELIDTEGWNGFWEDYADGIEGVQERLKDLVKEQAKAFADIRADSEKTLASLAKLEKTGGENIAKAIYSQEKKLADLRKSLSETDDTDRVAELQAEISEMENMLKKHNDVRKELAAEIAEIERRDELDPIAKAKEDFEKEKAILEERLKINAAFFEDTEMKKPKALADVISELKTLREGVLNEENQEYLDNLIVQQERQQAELDQAKAFLENARTQKEEIEVKYQTFLEEQRAAETVAFQAHLKEQETILAGHAKTQIARYNAIAAAARKAGQGGSTPSESSVGFAKGGYTGAGSKLDVAGLVHKNEYVIPSQMVNKLKPTGFINALENMRNGLKGFADGGLTSGKMQPAVAGDKNMTINFNNTTPAEANTGISGAALMYQLRPYL